MSDTKNEPGFRVYLSHLDSWPNCAIQLHEHGISMCVKLRLEKGCDWTHGFKQSRIVIECSAAIIEDLEQRLGFSAIQPSPPPSFEALLAQLRAAIEKQTASLEKQIEALERLVDKGKV